MKSFYFNKKRGKVFPLFVLSFLFFSNFLSMDVDVDNSVDIWGTDVPLQPPKEFLQYSAFGHLDQDLEPDEDSPISEEMFLEALKNVYRQNGKEIFICYWQDCRSCFEKQEDFLKHVNLHLKVSSYDEKHFFRCEWVNCVSKLYSKAGLIAHVKRHTR